MEWVLRGGEGHERGGPGLRPRRICWISGLVMICCSAFRKVYSQDVSLLSLRDRTVSQKALPVPDRTCNRGASDS